MIVSYDSTLCVSIVHDHIIPYLLPKVYDPGLLDPESVEESTIVEPSISEGAIKHAAAKWILKTRECHRIPQSVMESIVSGTQGVVQTALNGLQQTLQARLQQAHASPDVISLVTDCLSRESQYTHIFKGLETTHKQNSYIQKHFPFVVNTLPGPVCMLQC